LNDRELTLRPHKVILSAWVWSGGKISDS